MLTRYCLPSCYAVFEDADTREKDRRANPTQVPAAPVAPVAHEEAPIVLAPAAVRALPPRPANSKSAVYL